MSNAVKILVRNLIKKLFLSFSLELNLVTYYKQNLKVEDVIKGFTQGFIF